MNFEASTSSQSQSQHNFFHNNNNNNNKTQNSVAPASVIDQQHLVAGLHNLTIHDHGITSQIFSNENSVTNENSWFHLNNCSERIKLIVNLIKVPELGSILFYID